MIRQNLSQKMLQKLSPQQIQLMKLLQVPTAALEQRIKEEMESNPALDESNANTESTEEDKDETSAEDKADQEVFEIDDYLQEYMEDDPAVYSKYSSNQQVEKDDRQSPLVVESSIHDHLETQLGMLDGLTDRQMIIGHQIIGSIDDDGYLRRDALSISDDLLFTLNMDVAENEVNTMLQKVQTFDPPGIATSDLNECLLVQLDFYKDQILAKGGTPPEEILIANIILSEFFNEFTKKHFTKLLKNLDISEEELRKALDVILHLNPKPTTGFQGSQNASTYYIIPDYIIDNIDGELHLRLNNKNAPELTVNDQYQEMLRSYRNKKKKQKISKKDSEAFVFIKQKIDSAKWFIDAIKQRQDTMYRTMYAILQYQYDYFLSGDERRLRPMILKDIAELTGLDISTVSRVANSKYVQTEFGTKRLKRFFSESIKTLDGIEVSTLEVKNILAEMIDKENKKTPWSDEKLKEKLDELGYSIARRTVAKYREKMGVPVARLRKEF